MTEGFDSARTDAIDATSHIDRLSEATRPVRNFVSRVLFMFPRSIAGIRVVISDPQTIGPTSNRRKASGAAFRPETALKCLYAFVLGVNTVMGCNGKIQVELSERLHTQKEKWFLPISGPRLYRIQ
jgi:hypothetical protein